MRYVIAAVVALTVLGCNKEKEETQVVPATPTVEVGNDWGPVVPADWEYIEVGDSAEKVAGMMPKPDRRTTFHDGREYWTFRGYSDREIELTIDNGRVTGIETDISESGFRLYFRPSEY